LTNGPRFLAIRLRMDHGHGSGWAPPEIYAFAKAAVGRGSPLVSLREQGRDDKRVWVNVEPPAGVHVQSAELVYTKDRGDWVSRQWATVPAEISAAGTCASAELPDDTLVYFFNVRDNRDLTVSSEHVEVAAR
jgi:hypothetical protein